MKINLDATLSRLNAQLRRHPEFLRRELEVFAERDDDGVVLVTAEHQGSVVAHAGIQALAAHADLQRIQRYLRAGIRAPQLQLIHRQSAA